jgi:hypothetical protein
MVAHYLRRILSGVLMLLLASFLFYSISVHLSVQLPFVHHPSPHTVIRYYIQHYELQHPWPLNYAHWLFDPTEPDKPYSLLVDRKIIEYIPPYLDVQAGPVHLHGSGLLTGDLGLSGMVDRGVPVIDVIGRGGVQLSLAFLTCTNVLLMALSAVQRKGRKSVLGAASVLLAAVARIEATYRYARAAT